MFGDMDEAILISRTMKTAAAESIHRFCARFLKPKIKE
jgi:hypothetical protein